MNEQKLKELAVRQLLGGGEETHNVQAKESRDRTVSRRKRIRPEAEPAEGARKEEPERSRCPRGGHSRPER